MALLQWATARTVQGSRRQRSPGADEAAQEAPGPARTAGTVAAWFQAELDADLEALIASGEVEVGWAAAPSRPPPVPELPLLGEDAPSAQQLAARDGRLVLRPRQPAAQEAGQLPSSASSGEQPAASASEQQPSVQEMEVEELSEDLGTEGDEADAASSLSCHSQSVGGDQVTERDPKGSEAAILPGAPQEQPRTWQERLGRALDFDGSWYDVLDVEPTASKRHITVAFRKISLAVHPDKGGDALVFAMLRFVYEVRCSVSHVHVRRDSRAISLQVAASLEVFAEKQHASARCKPR